MAIRAVSDDADGVEELAAVSAASCLLSGLADRSRLTIVQHLLTGKHRVVDLTRHLGLAQSEALLQRIHPASARPPRWT